MLYNGVSNRSRGWKSKKPGDLLGAGVDGKPFRQPSLKKFDGAARSYSAWDDMRMDPEMWFRNGNCYIHLYEKGQSQRGAAFKVPFTCLIAAQCQPLIEKFVDRSVSEQEAYQNGRVDIYIPAPATASRSQALQYHLGIRNFFAWIFRRSLVGEQLGSALVGLVNTMEELREPDADNVQDVLDYVDEEGYRDMRNQPKYALALLHLAEALRLRDMYIDAFVHCVGMSERLFKHLEYSRISAASRKLIRRARLDMDFKLSRAGAMLGDLLREELSEAHVGLSAGARIHLDRFRAYVHGYYVTRFDAFPPPPPPCGRDGESCSGASTIFPPDVYETMKADFAALYDYLVDTTFTPGTAPAPLPMGLAQGGLCSLQSVHEFDHRHRFAPLDHPLPLLPELMTGRRGGDGRHQKQRRRSLPWLLNAARLTPRAPGVRPDQRMQAHAALSRATNHHRTDLMENHLVLAYRRFEEDSVMATGAQQHRGESGVGPADARKVRWLFIYAMYQTLRACARVAPEVRFRGGVGYHLVCNTKGAPPWWCAPGGVAGGAAQASAPPSASCKPGSHMRFPPADRGRSISAVPLLSPIISSERRENVGVLDDETGIGIGIEIKPDIDYFALTRQAAVEGTPTRKGRGRGAGGAGTNKRAETLPVRSRSQSLTRSMSLRRSLSLFRTSPQRRGPSSAITTMTGAVTPTRSLSRRSAMSFHEIIVHGYGKGTNKVADVSAPSSCPEKEKTEEEGDADAQPPAAAAAPPPPLSVVTTTTTTMTATLRSASTSSAASYTSSASTSSTAVQSTTASSSSAASTTPTTLGDPHSPTMHSRQASGGDVWAKAQVLPELGLGLLPSSATDAVAVAGNSSSCLLDGYIPAQYVSLTVPLRRKSTATTMNPRRALVRSVYSNDDMLLSSSLSSSAVGSSPPAPPLPRRSSKRFLRLRPASELGHAGGGKRMGLRARVPSGRSTSNGNNKRWSLVDVVAQLREGPNDDDDEDGEESDLGSAGGSMQPSPLRIHKTASQARMTDDGAVLAGDEGRKEREEVEREEEEEEEEESDWERMMHDTNELGPGLDVSTPHIWEQFTDLGGLQPIHLLGR